MKNLFYKINQSSLILTIHLLLGIGGSILNSVAFAGTVAQSPLFLAPPVKPNIMLMLDNSGSMNNILIEQDKPGGYNPSTTYIANCPTANLVAPCDSFGCVQIRVSAGKPQIYDGSVDWRNNTGTTSQLGTDSGQKCFSTTATYAALLIADNATNTAPAYGTGDADYSGNYLNWYFDAGNTADWTGKQKPGTHSRLEVGKESATALVNSLDNVRLGLSSYYGSTDGGALLEIIDDVDVNTSKKTAINDKINALKPENNTPLAETLSDIGRYFANGYSGNLTLHPGKSNQETASVASVFTQGSTSDHQLHNSSGQTVVNPIQYSCQKSFAVLMTDGKPHLDRDISTYMRDYTGDCAAGLCDATPTDVSLQILPATPLTTITYKNGTKIGRSYEWGGTDYLDDVANALFDMDLRPDLIKPTGEKNNLTTYTIGFADPILANDPLLKNTALLGGGLFKAAENSTKLNEAFKTIMADIGNQVDEGSASTLAASSSFLDATTKIYQAGFNSKGWTGSLKAYSLRTTSEDTNSNGILDSGEDTNNNGKLDGIGSIGTELWDAANKIPAAADRKILSYNPLATAAKGILFEWANLNATQKTALDATTSASATSSNILDYIRGDQSKEETVGPYRKRTSLLGDIINSDPLYVSNLDDFGYSVLVGSEGSEYTTFRIDKRKNRINALYFGANDGMFHAINAETGVELFTYVPNAVLPSLNKLTSPKYGCVQSGCLPHEYFVDGIARSGDAYIAIGSGSSPAWRTLLIGSTGAGSAKAVFALDVSNPSGASTGLAVSTMADNVLWEISPNQAPKSSDLVDDATVIPVKLGFTNHLGYTIPQSSIVKLQNGQWAAIVANGYSSIKNKAVLFIIDVATGEVIRSIDTQKGSDTTPNGLSTPLPVDLDGDRVVDYIYAGDLLGNLWKFDLTSTNPNDWKIAFSSTNPIAPLPLFSACYTTSAITACNGTNYQPITVKPQWGRNPAGGLMLYFGTGKYFEAGDQIVDSTTKINTFYAIRDQEAVITGRDRLQQQKILLEVGLDLNDDNVIDELIRATSNTEVDYAGNPNASPVVLPKLGWYMDLLPPDGKITGERVLGIAKLSGDRVLFDTMLPSTNSCEPGGEPWFLELEAISGKRTADPAFDVNRNGIVDSSDKQKLVDTDGDGSADLVSVSGRKSLDATGKNQGFSKQPVTIECGDDIECRYQGLSKNKIDKNNGSANNQTGRQSWRQLH